MSAALRSPNPSGCAVCGIDRAEHCQRWTEAAGWHTWQAPTLDQRRARMLTRRAHRSNVN